MKSLIKTALWNYRQQKMIVDLGSKEFKDNLFYCFAAASLIVTALLGWYTGGLQF